MIDMPMAGLRDRVLVSRERVRFADADPYGHLASGAYVDMVMSHRVQALEDLVGFSIMRHARSGVAFPARGIAVSYQRPAFVGETLEVASWVHALRTSSFEVRVVVAGADDRAVRALVTVHFVTVDARTGQPVPIPVALPSAAESDPLPGLPLAADHLATLTGLPARWPG